MKKQKSSRILAGEAGVSHTAILKARRRGLPDDLILGKAKARREAAASSDGGKEYRELVLREQKAKTEHREFALAVRRGEFVNEKEIMRLFCNSIMAVKNRFLFMPSKLGPILAACTDAVACQEVLRAEIYEALQEVSTYIREGMPNEPPETESTK